MDKVVAQRWVNALRSGEYRQTDGALQNDSGFCCLGVLCDLAVKEEIIPAPYLSDNGSTYVYGKDEELRGTELPPTSVREWSGLDPQEEFRAVIGSPGNRFEASRTLYSLNDDHEYSFEQIADVIEREYL